MQRLGTILGIIACLAAAGMAARPQAAECVTEATSPAEIDADEAQRLYDCLASEMRATFAGVEGVPGIPDYGQWSIVSSSPFISRTHGRMFINHIIDPGSEALYREWEGMVGRVFREGTVAAKESFLVDNTGRARTGPLFLMEKSGDPAAAGSGGWIYTRVFPDGRIERSGGPGSAAMRFCHDCHGAVMHQDAMFFPPRDYRAD